MALLKISTLRCFILYDILLLVPDSLLSSTVSGRIIKSSCWTWKVSPVPIFSFTLQPAVLNPHPGKEILLPFELRIVTVTSNTQRFLEQVFLVRTEGYRSLSSKPQWWLLWGAEKSLPLNQHLSAPRLEGSSIMLARHPLAVHYSLVQLGCTGAALEFRFLHWKSTLIIPAYSHKVLNHTHTFLTAIRDGQTKDSQVPSTWMKLHLFSESWAPLLMNQYIFIGYFLCTRHHPRCSRESDKRVSQSFSP